LEQEETEEPEITVITIEKPQKKKKVADMSLRCPEELCLEDMM